MTLRHFGLPALVAAAALCVPAVASASCEDYFSASRDLADPLASAYDAMSKKDSAVYASILPGLKARLDALPAAEIKAELCTDHVNAYTLAQYIELSTLKAHGVATGFPTGLPIVKQPDLNQSALAYAVGWIEYEQGDYDAALAAYGKGLAMFPQSQELENEYAATLIQLNRPEEVVTFVDKVLNGTYDLDDSSRAKMYAARGVALSLEGDTDSAIDALQVSQRYSYTDDVQGMLDSLQKVKDDGKGTADGTQ